MSWLSRIFSSAKVAVIQSPDTHITFGLISDAEYFDLLRGFGVLERFQPPASQNLGAIQRFNDTDGASLFHLLKLQNYSEAHLEVSADYAASFAAALLDLASLMRTRPNADTLSVATLADRLISGYRNSLSARAG